ncbi:MAG: PAS domain S-box protein [Ignavibacteriaceae bacterium]
MNAKILVVDDELSSVIYIQKTLELYGFNLLKHAETSEAAIRLAKSWQPELILMDINLGGEIDGIEAAEKICETEDIPIIFITGNPDDNNIKRAKKILPYGYLIKPFNSLQLLSMVEITLSNAASKKSFRESEERHRTTLYSIGDGVITVDTKGNIRNVNHVGEELTGWKESEAENKPLHEVFNIINEKSRSIIENPVDRVLNEGIIAGLTNHRILVSKNGREIPIANSSSPIKSEKGEILGVVLVFRDQTEERIAQKEVEESRLRFLSLFTNMKEGVALHELVRDKNNNPVNYRIIDTNPQFEKILGISRIETSGKLATEVYKTTKAPYLEVYCKVALTGESYTFESYFEPMEKHFLISVVPWLQNGFATIFTDISERKLAESELRKAHALTNAIVDSTVDMVWSVDPDKFGLLTFNRSLYEYMSNQHSIEIHQDMTPEDLMPTDELINSWKELYRRALSGGSYTTESRAYAGNIILQLTFNLLKNDGKVFGISVFGKDISEKIEKEKELIKYREHLEELVEEKTEQISKQNIFFRTLLDTIPNPIYVEDSNFRLAEVNKAYEEFTGMMRSYILGKTIFDIAPIETSNFPNQDDEKNKTNSYTTSYEAYARTKDKGKVPVMVYKSSFGLPGKKPEGTTAMIIDVTNQKKMEKITLDALNKERELNEMKTNFISIASHEFRTPLTTILSSAELLEKYYKKWEENKIKSHYKKIKLSVQNMIEILDDVLTLSRSDRGKINFNPSTLNLREFSAEIVDQVKLQALPGQNIIYEYKLPYEDISADPKLLNHILSNLLTNAVKFSPSGGDIVLSVEDENDFIKFTIKDSGIGIPAEDISKLFEPFFRAQNSAGIKGTGLGLSIVKRYVELHNGEISLESEPGKGTMFFVKIKK